MKERDGDAGLLVLSHQRDLALLKSWALATWKRCRIRLREGQRQGPN